VDWGFAAPREDAKFRGQPQGTPFTLSQNALHYALLAKQGDDVSGYAYTPSDELESAVKSLLLIISPSLKRCLKNAISAASSRRADTMTRHTYDVLKQCWDDVLSGTGLLELCSDCNYSGIVDWLTSNDRLFFWQPRL
jgi:hypothetical protein